MSLDGNGDNGGNEGGGAVTQGQQIAAILVHVGATRKGIQELERNVHEVKRSVDDLRERAVAKDSCRATHDRVDQAVRDLAGELRKRAPTGGGYPAVGAPGPVAAQGGTNPRIQALDPDRVLEEHRERTRRRWSFWLALLGTLLPLIGGAGYGLVKLGRYMDRMDTAIEATSKRAAQLKAAISEQPKVIYIKVPSAPDAGPKPRAGRNRSSSRGARSARRY